MPAAPLAESPFPHGLDAATAGRWVERWERQQERYAVAREERFTVIVDLVEAATAGCERPLVVDLGCGPGSLSARIAARLPGARVVAADIDPLLLALGRAHHHGHNVAGRVEGCPPQDRTGATGRSGCGTFGDLGV